MNRIYRVGLPSFACVAIIAIVTSTLLADGPVARPQPQRSRFSADGPRYQRKPIPFRSSLVSSAESVQREADEAAESPLYPSLDGENPNDYGTRPVIRHRPELDVGPANPPLPEPKIASDAGGQLPSDQHVRREAWWSKAVRANALRPDGAVPISLESLITSALANSAQIHVYQELPLIRDMAIMEADAAFDWTSFVESRWNDINEPVGNLLTTNEDRFSDHNLNTSFGVRRKNTYGGQFEISQRLGQQNTNSQFFIPHNQATSRLTLGYTQPLMRGRGKVYNTSLTVLARLDRDVARHEFANQLQGHLLEIARAYWGLYLERGNLLQRRRLFNRAKHIQDALLQRAEIDALRSQIVRAKSAVENRRSDILRAEMAVKNSESRIRALVNDQSLGSFDSAELIPQDLPFDQYMPIDIPTSVEEAIRNRPEINQAMLQIKSAGVRYNMSKNELLPSLNLVLETYASGLRGNSNLQNALTDQFDQGQPSYSVGVQYEFPLWNRAAQARYQKRRLELRQMEAQFRNALELLNLEVEVAVREVLTSYREIEAKYRAMDAARAEVEHWQDRWELLPSDDRSASLLLEDLLNAQERLTAAEYEFLDAQMNYSLSQISYRRAVGTLLITENISLQQYCDCYLPTTRLERTGPPMSTGIQLESLPDGPVREAPAQESASAAPVSPHSGRTPNGGRSR
ncbi:MAG: TolC family protein [Planctomycetales bacterium]|nr:TolC family protein [Planctomycetales bacterium]